jgi:hypothetical protein
VRSGQRRLALWQSRGLAGGTSHPRNGANKPRSAVMDVREVPSSATLILFGRFLTHRWPPLRVGPLLRSFSEAGAEENEIVANLAMNFPAYSWNSNGSKPPVLRPLRHAGCGSSGVACFRPRGTATRGEHAGQALSRYDVQRSVGTDRLASVSRPRLFQTPYALAQLRLFGLDEAGCG